MLKWLVAKNVRNLQKCKRKYLFLRIEISFVETINNNELLNV